MQIFSLVVRSPSSETQGQSVGSREKAERKFSSKGGKSPLVPTLTEPIPKIQADAGFWLGTITTEREKLATDILHS